MTEAEVSRVELALGRPLPARFRAFLVAHHDELGRIKAALPLRRLPYSDPEEMISDNEFAREVPNDVYLIVESNGAGDHWFIDWLGKDPGVWAWDDGMIKEVAGSPDELIGQICADLLDPEPWQFHL